MMKENDTSVRHRTEGVTLLGWAAVDLLTVGTALTLSQVLNTYMTTLTTISPLLEETRMSLQRHSFWIAIPFAGILFLLGWLKQRQRGDHRLMPQGLVVAIVVYGGLIQLYLSIADLHLRQFLMVFLILTAFMVMTIRFLVHHRFWLGEERSEKLFPSVFHWMDQRIRNLARQRPVSLFLGGAGTAMAASLIMVFSGYPGAGEILSNWAYLFFAVGVIVELAKKKRR